MFQKVHYISNYLFNVNDERIISYVPGRLDAFYSANNAGFADRLESFIYPSGLLTVKTLPEMNRRMKQIATYTKHYYIGAERISSVIGTGNSLGYIVSTPNFPTAAEISELNQKVAHAGQALQSDYDYFEKLLTLSPTFEISPSPGSVGRSENETPYWFHPDHLGSSSYISDENGEISQHMAYFPFGETLVEEHKNSNNSPFKFNAKELDACPPGRNETGNYYYGARYYSPKDNLMLSVDPASEMYPSFSPYAYTLQNPVKYIDPTGMVVEDPPVYEITLDEVVITANTSNSNKKADYSGMPQWMRNTAFMNNHWYTPSDGSIDDYNNEHGTDYGDHNPGDLYMQWYYQTYYKSAHEEMIRSIHGAQRDFLIGAYDLTADGLQDGGDALALMGYGLTLTGVGAEIGVPMMSVGKGMAIVGGGMNAMSSYARGNKYESVLDITSIGLGAGSGYFFKTSRSGTKMFSKTSRELMDTNTNLKISLINRYLSK